MILNQKLTKDINNIISGLSRSPEMLKSLLSSIPEELLKTKPNPKKWCIHEHATHICAAEKNVVLPRLKKFINEDSPRFQAISGESFPPMFFMNLDLEKSLEEFEIQRKKTIKILQKLTNDLWHKKGVHPEYCTYSPLIMARHYLMHDFHHMYLLEDLWLSQS